MRGDDALRQLDTALMRVLVFDLDVVQAGLVGLLLLGGGDDRSLSRHVQFPFRWLMCISSSATEICA